MKKNKTLILFLVAAAIAIAVYFYMKKAKPNATTETTEADKTASPTQLSAGGSGGSSDTSVPAIASAIQQTTGAIQARMSPSVLATVQAGGTSSPIALTPVSVVTPTPTPTPAPTARVNWNAMVRTPTRTTSPTSVNWNAMVRNRT